MAYLVVLSAVLVSIPQESGTTVRLQAVSVVGENVVWVSGLGGTYGRTLDSGESWRPGIVPGAEKLEFRDVHAVDANTAYLLSAGTGEQSRIYKTMDGGASWNLQLVNDEPKGFFDCFDFWDAEHGLVYGDSVDGELVVLETSDGESWTPLPEGSLPKARPGEGGFAASGTCLVTGGESTAYIGTGAGSSRLLRTTDRGRSWEVFETPIVSATETAGVTSLSFWDEENGIAAGGDIAAPDGLQDNVAILEGGGRSARLTAPPTFSGAIYGVAHVPGTSPPIFVAVGPKGASYSLDSARTWVSLSEDSYWSVGFQSSPLGGLGWMVGPEGRIARLELRR